MAGEGWQPGDRVQVRMHERRGWRWVSGTVREVDPPEHRPGVRLELDRLVHGTRACYATHDELEPETPDNDGAGGYGGGHD